MKAHIVATLSLIAFACCSQSAIAGQKVSNPVTVTSNSAYGNMGTARNSADGNQRIGCQVSATSSSSVIGARCEAASAQGEYVACGTNSPQLVQLIMSIKGDSNISFTFGPPIPGQLPQCTAINIDNNSLYEPKK